MRHTIIPVVAALLSATPAALANLQAQDPLARVASPPEPSLVWPVLGGALLGIGGWITGAVAGAAAEANCTDGDYCQAEGIFLGAAVGGTAGLALGAHLGNRRRGNLALDFLSGALVWGASIGAFYLVGADLDEPASVAVLVAEPVLQLVTTVAVERARGRSIAKSRVANLVVAPNRDGRVSLGFSLAF